MNGACWGKIKGMSTGENPYEAIANGTCKSFKPQDSTIGMWPNTAKATPFLDMA